ncbi:hypothetical protein [Tropicimonas sp.]|uniref:hypothetical protein n=1 Tax=Tropicimonas sp. TaxID=2067044 RepID=UPI003A8AD046
MATINRIWHAKHPMPRNPTDRERLEWHLDHAAHCGCREIPKSILALMELRGIPRPELRDSVAK